MPDLPHHRVLLLEVQPGTCALGAYTCSWFAWREDLTMQDFDEQWQVTSSSANQRVAIYSYV